MQLACFFHRHQRMATAQYWHFFQVRCQREAIYLLKVICTTSRKNRRNPVYIGYIRGINCILHLAGWVCYVLQRHLVFWKLTFGLQVAPNESQIINFTTFSYKGNVFFFVVQWNKRGVKWSWPRAKTRAYRWRYGTLTKSFCQFGRH